MRGSQQWIEMATFADGEYQSEKKKKEGRKRRRYRRPATGDTKKGMRQPDPIDWRAVNGGVK